MLVNDFLFYFDSLLSSVSYSQFHFTCLVVLSVLCLATCVSHFPHYPLVCLCVHKQCFFPSVTVSIMLTLYFRVAFLFLGLCLWSSGFLSINPCFIFSESFFMCLHLGPHFPNPDRSFCFCPERRVSGLKLGLRT